MYKQIDSSEAGGKTVEKVTFLSSYDGNVVVSFRDETFLLFSIVREWQGTQDEEVYISDALRTLPELSYHGLIRSGVISQQELDELRHEQYEAQKRKRREEEFCMWRRLKRIFDPEKGETDSKAPQMLEGEL
jgi:hypothetical protein